MEPRFIIGSSERLPRPIRREMFPPSWGCTGARMAVSGRTQASDDGVDDHDHL